jgi:histidinol-phosphate aminotransferase
MIEDGLSAMGLQVPASQTNFVMAPISNAAAVADVTMRRGVIIRPMGNLVRISVGTPEENRRLLDVLADSGVTV